MNALERVRVSIRVRGGWGSPLFMFKSRGQSKTKTSGRHTKLISECLGNVLVKQDVFNLRTFLLTHR